MKKILSFILILLITLSTAASCSLFKKDEAVNDTDNTANTSEAVVNDDSESEHYDEVLDDDDVGSDISSTFGDELLEEKKAKGISFDQEDDEAVVEPVKSDVAKYFGSWIATSDKAEYLYGNVDITINEDGTWVGVITDEHLNGKWKDQGDRLQMQSEIFSFFVAFDKSGKLIMIENNHDSEINTVLTRK